MIMVGSVVLMRLPAHFAGLTFGFAEVPNCWDTNSLMRLELIRIAPALNPHHRLEGSKTVTYRRVRVYSFELRA